MGRPSANTLCGLVARSFHPSVPFSRCGSPRENMTSQARQSSTGSASEGPSFRFVRQSNLLHPFCSRKFLCRMEADIQLPMFTLAAYPCYLDMALFRCGKMHTIQVDALWVRSCSFDRCEARN